MYRYDDLGNVHYGYVGSAGGISDFMLQFGAGMNQTGYSVSDSIESGGPTWGDHKRDNTMIMRGINQWKSR